MARTIRGSKSIGYDFWSRRSGTSSYGRIAKQRSKQVERTRDKKLERQAFDDPENVEARFSGE